jgi:hypothetical protein
MLERCLHQPSHQPHRLLGTSSTGLWCRPGVDAGMMSKRWLQVGGLRLPLPMRWSVSVLAQASCILVLVLLAILVRWWNRTGCQLPAPNCERVVFPSRRGCWAPHSLYTAGLFNLLAALLTQEAEQRFGSKVAWGAGGERLWEHQTLYRWALAIVAVRWLDSKPKTSSVKFPS